MREGRSIQQNKLILNHGCSVRRVDQFLIERSSSACVASGSFNAALLPGPATAMSASQERSLPQEGSCCSITLSAQSFFLLKNHLCLLYESDS